MATRDNIYEGLKGCLEQENGSDVDRIMKVAFGNSASVDSFGRLRISEAIDLFDNKNISSRNSEQFDEVTSGAGQITYSRQTSSVSLIIGPTNGDRALRQSRYIQYVPGKSQKITMTGVLASSSSDDMFVVRRTSTSGVASDTRVARA